jgi:hypothetical protein
MCEWGTEKAVHLYKPMQISKRKIIMVDSCIADIVQALNNFEIETIGCCCGHNKYDGEITLADGRQIIIKQLETHLSR